jgi:predicted DNA-binding transcriptional regulator AlpA
MRLCFALSAFQINIKSPQEALSMSEERLLKLRDVENRVGRKRSSIYALITQGRFPSPVMVNKQNRWSSSAIEKYISDALAGAYAAK